MKQNELMKQYIRQLFEEGADNDNGDEGAKDTGANDNSGKDGKDDNKDKGGKTYTEDEVNALIDKVVGQKFAKWQKEQKKATDEAAKLATMTAQERAEHERDELQKQLDEYKRQATMAEMAKEARKIGKEQDVNIPDDILGMIIADDAETTKKSVNAYITAFKAAVLAEVKAQIGSKTTKKGGSGTVTKEQIMAIKDTKARQEAIKEHMELFA
jgi:hypothetical protein